MLGGQSTGPIRFPSHPKKGQERVPEINLMDAMNKRNFRNVLISVVATVMIYAAPLQSTYAAPTFQVDVNGVLAGATSIDVGGALYDVIFNDGTCVALFNGCNSASDFAINTPAAVIAASQALLDQVFTNGSVGNFDSSPMLTRGCGPLNITYCDVLTPYASFGLSNVASMITRNYGGTTQDLLVSNISAASLFTATNPNVTWAVWTPSVPVPLPTPLALLFSGCAGLLVFQRLRDQRYCCPA